MDSEWNHRIGFAYAKTGESRSLTMNSWKAFLNGIHERYSMIIENYKSKP